jgi:membrane glycosyltransferase
LYRPEVGEPDVDDVTVLLRDPELLAAHRQMLPPGRRPGVDPLDVPLLTGTAKLGEAERLGAVWPTLSTPERAAVLSDRRGLEALVALWGSDAAEFAG